jgi:UDP-glucose 4-epimerase
MKAFVTGGTGMVGRVFLPRLVAEGWEVTALTRDPQKAGLPRHERLTYLAGDLSDSATVERLLAQPARHDVIFHLAASLDYFGKLDRLLATNAGGTAAMVRFARHAGARRFVYASSVEAAGAFRRSEIPAPPEKTGRPLTAYGASKVVAEKYALELGREGIAPICLRIGNVYGPGWANFVVELAQNLVNRGSLWEYLPLYGERYWSPVWNDDVTDGLLHVATGTQTGIENLVGQAATVEEMFHFCADAMGVPFSSGRRKLSDSFYVCLQANGKRWLNIGHGSEYDYLLTPSWPWVHRCCGMEDSSRRLGWEPRMSLREGIRQTLLWARSAGLLQF